MADAKYTVMIPTVDNLGNPLVDVAQFAHHWLYYNLNNRGSWIERGKIGMWRDENPEPYDMLITVAEDTPEMDSAIKQLAVYVAEVCNQWGLFAMKEGKHGVMKWEIANPQYKPGQPADQVSLQNPDGALAQTDTPTPAPAPAAYGGDETIPLDSVHAAIIQRMAALAF